ncbi:ECF transporter S component [Metabacillus litoralis]|uniref:ECF transporter S component n=1 Tax=Metabacillus TaxID=2675233 RepID=UPI001B91B477|nr:ECF transporter S component [Metabacillus litoralis]MCM3163208.1 ECF transporter S component [Metabacillus litoralis]UHA58800.1 ECF transporter S component [Metabacillus litoralis]
MNKKNNTFRLVLLGMLTAIIIIQTSIPFLGYIPIGPLSLTIIQVTVIIAAIVLGTKEGAIIGGIWGMITFIRAFVAPTSVIAPIVFTNPLVSVLPRILIGVVAAYVFHKMLSRKLNETVRMSIAGVLGSLTNTVLVLGLIYLFYREPYANFLELDMEQLLPALMTIVATNGITEAIISGLLTPIISKPLLKLIKK